MKNREEVITYCETFPSAYLDHPFKKSNVEVMRHRLNNKVFVWLCPMEENLWINVKLSGESRDFFRSAYESVVPGWHLNKEHWSSIILDGSVKRSDIEAMIEESFELTKGGR